MAVSLWFLQIVIRLTNPNLRASLVLLAVSLGIRNGLELLLRTTFGGLLWLPLSLLQAFCEIGILVYLIKYLRAFPRGNSVDRIQNS